MTIPAPLKETTPSDIARTSAALGLDETADADAILVAIDPARNFPIEAFADLLKQRGQRQCPRTPHHRRISCRGQRPPSPIDDPEAQHDL